MSKRDEVTVVYSVALSTEVALQVNPTKAALTGDALLDAISQKIIAQILKDKSCKDLIDSADIQEVVSSTGGLIASSLVEDEDEFPEIPLG